MTNTEYELKEWRGGSITSERMCADILIIEGYTGIDPQCPLGGQDGLKDIICKKNDICYIAAIFFPPTHQTFQNVKKKFVHDLMGVDRNEVNGFIFFINQHLSLKEREKLIGEASCKHCEIYHLERIRTILDSPSGLSTRLKYLKIPMSIEDQTAFIHTFTNRHARQEAEMKEMREIMERVYSIINRLDEKL